MTDREMLELAAKAFWGDDIDDCCSVRWLEVDQAIGYTHADNQDHNGEDRERVWNPLTDDGDALRLFCALPWMCIETSDVAATVRERGNPDDPSRVYFMWTEWLDQHNGDVAAATRRAVTRAAAEIGRVMP